MTAPTPLPSSGPVRPPASIWAGRPLLVAPIAGLPAQAFRLLLEPQLADALERWQRGGLPAAGAAEIRAAFAVLVVAADEHLARRACVDESAQVTRPQVVAGSAEIGTAAAAELLGCSPQWVRQLLAAGVLDGRLVGGRWLIARECVVAKRGMDDASRRVG